MPLRHVFLPHDGNQSASGRGALSPLHQARPQPSIFWHRTKADLDKCRLTKMLG
jgi:hypothetical protein